MKSGGFEIDCDALLSSKGVGEFSDSVPIHDQWDGHTITGIVMNDARMGPFQICESDEDIVTVSLARWRIPRQLQRDSPAPVRVRCRPRNAKNDFMLRTETPRPPSRSRPFDKSV